MINDSQLEIGIQKKVFMIEAVEKSQACQMAFVESRFMGMMGVDESDEVYQSFRSTTTVGLEVGSLVTSRFKIFSNLNTSEKRKTSEFSEV